MLLLACLAAASVAADIILPLILAFVSFAVITVNVAGLLFIGFSLILFIADIKVPSHGVLTAGTPFLQKPYSPKSLVEKVREVLN